MAQSATMTKLRGRHFAARARAAEIKANATTKAVASNQSLALRLKNNRFQNARYNSPSTREASENNSNNNNSTNNDVNSRNPSTKPRDRTLSSRASGLHTKITEQRQRQSQIAEMATETAAGREMEIVKGISDRLDTGLNESALGAILELLKRGEHPDAIVAVVTSLAKHSR